MEPGVVKKVKITGIVCFGFLLIAGLGFGYFIFHSSAVKSNDNQMAVIPTQDQDKAPDAKETAPASQDGGMAVPESGKRSIIDQIVHELQKYYGKTITEKSTQIKLLKVKKYLIKLYPEEGEKKFQIALRRAFPDLADEILTLLSRMEAYENWLVENADKLSQANKLEKEGLLWKAREEIFGKDTKEIWNEELLSFEKKKQEVRETINFLNEANDMTVYEKLDIYRSALQDAYQGSSEEFVLENKDLLGKVFFSIDSVQDQLKGLSPEDRKIEMANIRREMGFTQVQIEGLEKMDEYRNQRWENGLAYMEERQMAEQEFEGPELESRLKELREKFFKHESKTIELEENDSFFRYKRPRIYGRN